MVAAVSYIDYIGHILRDSDVKYFFGSHVDLAARGHSKPTVPDGDKLSLFNGGDGRNWSLLQMR